MNLHVLKEFDPETANGILAAAALTTSPNPGVGERPFVLRTYEKEAAAAVAEIRERLKIKPDADPEQVQALISKTIADTLRQSILGNADADAILERIGNAGRLPPAAYDVVQPPEFQNMFYRLGVSRNHVDDAVKHPDDHQHLMTEGMPETWQDISLFMKFIASREQRRRHWLLVQTHRVGVEQRVGAAWRIYPDDVNLELAQQPLDVLKAFVEVYGFPITVGDTKALFVESETYPPGVAVKIDWTGSPENHFVSISQTTDLSGHARIGVTYCVDIPKYTAALRKHGVKVEALRQVIGRSITTTRTEHRPTPASV